VEIFALCNLFDPRLWPRNLLIHAFSVCAIPFLFSHPVIQVVIFCLKERDGTPAYSGAVADRIRRRADKYIELPKSRGLAWIRSQIEAEKVDTLVFAEIGMDPVNYLLAFARLAPVQVCLNVMQCCTAPST
jgi:hypothetical protein